MFHYKFESNLTLIDTKISHTPFPLNVTDLSPNGKTHVQQLANSANLGAALTHPTCRPSLLGQLSSLKKEYSLEWHIFPFIYKADKKKKLHKSAHLNTGQSKHPETILVWIKLLFGIIYIQSSVLPLPCFQLETPQFIEEYPHLCHSSWTPAELTVTVWGSVSALCRMLCANPINLIKNWELTAAWEAFKDNRGPKYIKQLVIFNKQGESTWLLLISLRSCRVYCSTLIFTIYFSHFVWIVILQMTENAATSEKRMYQNTKRKNEQ